ncbi:MAG TPA: hypothetical protein VI685_16095 [Candidatus Angelobacter sp.]
MKYTLGILEALLALAFLATAVFQLLRGKPGATDLASALILIAIGLWLAKMAVTNLRSKPSMKQ